MELSEICGKTRYETGAHIEEYAAWLANPRYNTYKQRLEFDLILGKYFLLKRYGNVRKKSLIPLPPRAFFDAIELTEQDLEWKLRFGPYELRKDVPYTPIFENVDRNLKDKGFAVRKEMLEALLTQLFCRMKDLYPDIIKDGSCFSDDEDGTGD
jgi:hypothetical protein